MQNTCTDADCHKSVVKCLAATHATSARAKAFPCTLADQWRPAGIGKGVAPCTQAERWQNEGRLTDQAAGQLGLPLWTPDAGSDPGNYSSVEKTRDLSQDSLSPQTAIPKNF